MVPARPSPLPYRLPDRENPRGHFVGVVLLKAQRRRARRMAERLRRAGSDVFRVALDAHEPQARRRKAEP